MKKSELKQLIKEEIRSVFKEDTFEEANEMNPSNKMIWDLLKEVKVLVIQNQRR